jgi:Tfp pilus assembly protein PilO
MGFKSTKNREKILVVITAVVVVAVFIFVVVIDPQLKQRSIRSQQLHQLQIKLTKMNGNLLLKDRIDKIYSQIEPLIATEATEQQQISTFTRQLSQVYSKLNVEIRSVKILPITKEDFYNRLSIKIEMTGHIKSFLGFVEAIEQHAVPIRIEQIEIVAQQSEDNIRVSMIVSKVVSDSKHS